MVWAAAVTDAAARYQEDRGAAREVVEASQAEALEAGKLVDTEAARADVDATRATGAEEQLARLREQLTEQGSRHLEERRAVAAALEQVRTREALAETRGALTILQDQAALYWNKTNTSKNPDTGQ